MPIKVLVVDDHWLFRQGVTAVIKSESDFSLVAEAANGREAVRLAKELRPDIVLMDLNMPEMDGVEATGRLMKEVPGTNVLMLTMSDQDEDLFSAIKAGAKGYLLKESSPMELVRAISHVAGGGVIISSTMAPKLLAEIGNKTNQTAEPDLSVLSPREIEIVKLVAEELTDKEIAERLVISLNTVKAHLKNILGKLQVKSRTQVASYLARKDSQKRKG